MMLTGSEIVKMREVGSVVIEPFDPIHVEVNSYGCHLADLLLEYRSDRIDPHGELEVVEHHIPPEGFVLYPNRFYLGAT
ncbi:deoxycytidine triphosphate deaminase (dCTP deaminase), partial [Pseudomonas savastanoi pv. glycinea str. race 4]